MFLRGNPTELIFLFPIFYLALSLRVCPVSESRFLQSANMTTISINKLMKCIKNNIYSLGFFCIVWSDSLSVESFKLPDGGNVFLMPQNNNIINNFPEQHDTKGGFYPFNQCLVFTITLSFNQADMATNTPSYASVTWLLTAVMMHLITHI